MRILVAEDQPTAALFLRRTLERLGHEVVLAADGAEAWRLEQEEGVSIVISDWMMPGMDGLELCRRIRLRAGLRYSYIILLTSKDLRTERLEGLRAGADDFLVKPVDADELAVRLQIAQRIVGVQEQLEQLNRRLAELVTTDGLTGVRNRRSFDELLLTAVSFAVRQSLPLSLMMIDVDQFKAFNDTFGHPAGDRVLRTVADLLRQNCREHDEVARYGGEEFAILLPGTDLPGSLVIGERLRAIVAEYPWPMRQVTISVGIATTRPGTPRRTTLVEHADRALYRSKQLGRNRVTHHDLDLASRHEGAARVAPQSVS